MTTTGLGHPPNAPYLPKAPRLAHRLSRTTSEGDLKRMVEGDFNKSMVWRPSETRQPAVTRPLPAVEPAPHAHSNQTSFHHTNQPLFTEPNYFLRDSS